MTPELHIERMGNGHAMTVSLTYRLEPGELIELHGNPERRNALSQQIADQAQRDIFLHLPNQLQRAKVK